MMFVSNSWFSRLGTQSFLNPYKLSVLFMGYRQAVQIQIRHRIMRCLIRKSTVCLQNFLLKFGKKHHP